jgi:hypothetical protein
MGGFTLARHYRRVDIPQENRFVDKPDFGGYNIAL